MLNKALILGFTLIIGTAFIFYIKIIDGTDTSAAVNTNDPAKQNEESVSQFCPDESTGRCRPYDDDAAWNTPIGNNPVIDPNSATFINAIADNNRQLTSDVDQYALPVYLFNNNTPRIRVQLRGGYWQSYDNGDNLRVGHGYEPLILDVPLPPGANSSQGTDGQIIIWDPAAGIQWEFWQWRPGQNMDPNGDDYTGRGNFFDLGNTTVNLCNYVPATPTTPATSDCHIATNATRYHSIADSGGNRYFGRFNGAVDGTPATINPPKPGVGGRGAGTPYLAGLVRPWEIAQGRIDHALAFAYDQPASSWRFPATKSDGHGVSGVDLPEGTLIQLDPALTDADLTAMGLNANAKIIAKALQRYGMYTIDAGGSSKIFMEDRITANWDASYTRSILSNIPWSRFRVLASAPTPVPTAAVLISGKVVTLSGKGVNNAFITMTNAAGISRQTRTNPFGYYRFTGVATGQTYIFNIRSKRYNFTPQTVTVTEELANLNFIAEP